MMPDEGSGWFLAMMGIGVLLLILIAMRRSDRRGRRSDAAEVAAWTIVDALDSDCGGDDCGGCD